MTSCIGCKHHSIWAPVRFLSVDFCARSGDAVGLECPLGCIDTEGCPAYERPFSWPPGAIS